MLNCTKAKPWLIHPLLLSTKPGMSWHSAQNVCWMNEPHLHSSDCEPWTSNTSIAWESGRKAGSPHLRLLEPESEQALQVICEHVTILQSLYLNKHTSFQPLDMYTTSPIAPPSMPVRPNYWLLSSFYFYISHFHFSLNVLLRSLYRFSPIRGFICTHLRLISASCQGPVSLPSCEIPHGLGGLTPAAPSTTPSPWKMLLSGLIHSGTARKREWKEK